MEINLHYKVCGKMPKTDKVGFSSDFILNVTQETQDKTSDN